MKFLLMNTLIFASFAKSSYTAVILESEDTVLTNCVKNGTLSITFDDGPHLYQTHELLDMLRATNVTATFFVVGVNVVNDTAKETLKRAVAEGHTIGHHTWSHSNLTAISADDIRLEMTKLADELVAILGNRPSYMRPPYGEYDETVVDIVSREMNYTMVTWSIDTNDWRHPGDTEAGLFEYVEALNNTVPGETQGFIGLHHDVHAGALELATAAIQYGRSMGYTFVSMDDCSGGEHKN